MKKHTIALVLLLCVIASGAVFAQSKKNSHPVGIGLFLGQPTGIVFEFDLNATNWVDITAAWDFTGPTNQNYAFLLFASYKLAFPGVFVINNTVDLVPFVGPGLSVGLRPDDVSIGFRIPFGLSWRPSTVPLGIYLEIGLGMQLFPATSFQGTGGLGIQYRF